MVLFLQADYPVTHGVLKKLNVSSTTKDGRATVPNLSQLFEIIFPTDEETFNQVVRSFLNYYSFLLQHFLDPSAVLGGVSGVSPQPSCQDMYQ